MKKLFFTTWGALSLLLVVAALHAVWNSPSFASGFFLLLVGYYALCFFQLIRAAYQPWGLLGPSRTGYWLCLVLLPLSLLPLEAAYEVWEQGVYAVGPEPQHDRFSVLLFRQLLVWLQELVGHLGPILLLAVTGLGMALLLLRLLRGQAIR